MPRPPPHALPGLRGRTGILKEPVGALTVHDPGPREAGGRSGVVGDHVHSRRHHGGDSQAVYAFAREELDHWERELRVELGDGSFGENLTTAGLEVDAAEVPLLFRAFMGDAALAQEIHALAICRPREQARLGTVLGLS